MGDRRHINTGLPAFAQAVTHRDNGATGFTIKKERFIAPTFFGVVTGNFSNDT